MNYLDNILFFFTKQADYIRTLPLSTTHMGLIQLATDVFVITYSACNIYMVVKMSARLPS